MPFIRSGAAIYLNIMEPGSNSLRPTPGSFCLKAVSELPADMYLIMSVGGDGTFLETAMRVRETGIPVAGINTGRLGFLANIPDDDIGKAIEMLFSGDYDVISRSMLEVVISRRTLRREAAPWLSMR